MILCRCLQQLLRKPGLVMLYGLLLCLLTAMLSIGLLLMTSSVDLAQQTEDAYSTIGVVEFFRDVPTGGAFYRLKYQLESGLLSPEEYLENQALYLEYKAQGKDVYGEYRYPLKNGTITPGDAETLKLPDQVESYDLGPLVDSPYVLDYENRARYGAYNPQIESSTTRDIHTALAGYDILIFTYTGDRALTLDNDFCWEQKDSNTRTQATHDVPVKVIWSYLAERYDQQNFLAETSLPIIFTPEHGEDLGVLEPGKTYITVCSVGPQMREWKKYEHIRSVVRIPEFFDGVYRSYLGSSSGSWQDSVSTLTTHPAALLCAYTEGFWDTAAGKRFEAIRRLLDVNYHSAAVMTSSDLNLLQAFHNEELYARQGRLFTEEEYTRGSPVCLVSYDMAQAAGWQLGDRVELALYACDTFTSYAKAKIYTGNFTPTYQGQDFFSTQTYEIVGLYDGPALAAGENIKLKRDEAGNVIDPDLPPYLLTTNLIFVPEGSVQNAPETRPASFLTATVRVDNGTADLYLNDLEKRGLLDSDAQGVRAQITFYDQGYHQAAGLAESTGSAARTVIALALAAALVTVILFAYLYVSRRRREVALLRAMGISAGKIGAVLSVCLLLVTATAAVLGCGLGAAAAGAAETLFLRDDTAQLNNLFSASYGEGINKAQDLTLTFGPQPFALAAAVVLGLVTAAVGVMLFAELRKSPMALLSGKGERS